MGSHFRTLTLPLLTLASLATCTRDRVDLDRPCSVDADCIGATVCSSGVCESRSVEICGAIEVCDGFDNDCNDSVDDGFACRRGAREPCGEAQGERFCLDDCTYSACEVGWLDGAWTKRLPVTIAAGAVSETLDNVPIPVGFDDATIQAAGIAPSTLIPGGRDVIVALPDGTRLAHQVETWSSETGYLVWVRVPRIEPTAVVTFYIYLGNPDATDTSTADVWDSGYAGVWHLADASGAATFEDATHGNHDATGRSSEPGVGVFASGQAFAGSQALRAEALELPEASDFTMEAWLHAEAPSWPYRRDMTVNVPVADMEVVWPTNEGDAFDTRSGRYTTLLTLDDNGTSQPFGVLKTLHGIEVWTRFSTAGEHHYALAYGNEDAVDPSDPAAVFHFWAFGDSWDQFTPTPSASYSRVGTRLDVFDGRLTTQIPVDMREGFLAQSYVAYSQSIVETRVSGGLPHIASVPDVTNVLSTPASGVFVYHDLGVDNGSLLTSGGSVQGFDAGSPYGLDGVTGDISVGINDGVVSIIADQSTVLATVSVNWVSPLRYLLLGSYNAQTSIFPTSYLATFVRRWPGTNAIADAGTERVAGLSLGGFGISAEPDFIYASTNLGIQKFPATPNAHHVAIVVRELTGEVFIDGERVWSGAIDPRPLLRGLNLGESYAFDGVLDEVRLSSIARSAAWLATTSKSRAADFAALGAVETLR